MYICALCMSQLTTWGPWAPISPTTWTTNKVTTDESASSYHQQFFERRVLRWRTSMAADWKEDMGAIQPWCPSLISNEQLRHPVSVKLEELGTSDMIHTMNIRASSFMYANIMLCMYVYLLFWPPINYWPLALARSYLS